MSDLIIYAAGEIHSDWRDALREALSSRGVTADVVAPHCHTVDRIEPALGAMGKVFQTGP